MTLEEAKKENYALGKKALIEKLVKRYTDGIKKMTVLDLIKDHFELYPEFQSKRLLNKVRKVEKKEAQHLFIKHYQNELKRKTLTELVEENT